MDFNATIDLIIKDLDEARLIIDDLKRYPGVPALQVELAKSKCKSAGEVIALLKTIGDNLLSHSEDHVQQKREEEREQEHEREHDREREHEREQMKVPNEILITSDEPVSQILNLDELKDDTVKNESILPDVKAKVESAEIPLKEPESTIIADKFSHLSQRFNEKMGSKKHDDDISEIMKAKTLTNLSEAIGLNDKFLFMREIFKGNKDAYVQAISRLETADNLNDARAIIMSYTGENKDNEAVKQLLDLVKRKLPSNE